MALGSQITQIRLPSGKVVALVDWTDKPLWSTIDVQSGWTDQNIDAFTYVVSDQVVSSANITTRRVATERDTNVATPGAMASTEELLIYAIKIQPWAFNITGNDATTRSTAADGLPMPNPATLAGISAQCLVQLIISQKVYAEAELTYFAAGFGVVVAGRQADADSRFYAANGVQSQEAVRSFVVPHHIGGQEKYRFSLFNPTGAAVTLRDDAGGAVAARLLSITVYFDGLYKRPVS